MSAAEFFEMGGYGFYVWGAYGLTAVLLVVEVIAVWARLRNARVAASGEDAR